MRSSLGGMRLLLIRHGQTPANVLGQLDTAAPGPGLTALGERQAIMIPEALRLTPVDSISASILVRTQLTAEPLALDRGIPAQVRPGIHEIAAGDLEDRTDRASVRTYLETVFAWADGDLDRRMPGALDGHEFYERFDSDIDAICAEGGESAVVFSHGAAIRVWVAGRATNVPARFAAENELNNTGVVELTGAPEDGWRLDSWAGTALGGSDLDDSVSPDPTGETLREARGDG